MPKPTFYVPGLPGSHLLDRQTGKKLFLNILALLSSQAKNQVLRRLKGPDDLVQGDDVVAGHPIRRATRLLVFDIAKQADSLHDILRAAGVDSAKFGWDWRRPVYDEPMLASLQQNIERLHNTSGQRVVVIAHSTGGLVVRRLLERNGDNAGFLDCIERVIAFGVPWAGTLKSLLFLDGEGSFALLDKREAQELLSHSWAAFDLLPPDPARTNLTDQAGQPLDLVVDGGGQQVSPLIKRDWFRPEFSAAMNLRAAGADHELGQRSPTLELPAGSIPVTNVVGWGKETTVQARITGSGAQQRIVFNPDKRAGKGDETLDGGDGTVPRVSADWLRGPDVNTYHVPVGFDPGAKLNPHSVLWRNPGGRNLLCHLVGGQPLKPFLYGAVDDQDFGDDGDSVRVRLVALDAAGQPLTDASVRTTDLPSGPAVEEAFNPVRQGRHLLRIPRARMRPVSNTLRRFTIEIRGREGDQTRTQRRSFFCRR